MTGSWRLPEHVRPGGRFDQWAPSAVRYLVTDVDGTLLGPSPTATAAVLSALRRAKDAGLHVGFATGRMVSAVEPLWRETRIPGPHILHNGAMVRRDGKRLAAWPLSTEQVHTLLRLCRDRGLYAELYTGGGYVVTDRRPEAAIHWHMLHQEPAGLTEDLDPEDNEVVKATVVLFEGDPSEPVIAALRAAGLAAGVATSPLAPGVAFVNVTDPDVSKGRALACAARAVDVELGGVVAVGDGLNDLSMLEAAGTAIAMAQAPDEVLAAAHLVVPEVEADGVVHALDAAVTWAGRQSRSGTW